MGGFVPFFKQLVPLVAEVYSKWWSLHEEINTDNKRIHFKNNLSVLLITVSLIKLILCK